MIHSQEIYGRFLMSCPGLTPAALARELGLHPSTISQWKSGKRPIPWEHIKRLADTHAVRLDWLMEGTGPQYKEDRKRRGYAPLNHGAVNKRFFSLFPGMPQAELGRLLGFRQMSVYRWFHNMAPVPRECLGYAVANKNVTWEWLLTGRK